MARFRKGSRVESRRWPGTHGTVTGRDGERVFVRWDGAVFSEDETTDAELKPSRRPAPKDPGPGYLVVRGPDR
jgi:hypothetical protein